MYMEGGGGRPRLLGGVFLMQCISRFGINLHYTTVARGVIAHNGDDTPQGVSLVTAKHSGNYID